MYILANAALFGIFLILITMLIVVLPIAIIFRIKAGRIYRKELARTIDELQMGRMLAALGIDTRAYLVNEDLADIKEHLKKCESCKHIEECEEDLASGRTKSDNIDYCENKRSWKK